MLGNGYCTRPVAMDCHFDSICESCSFFVTSIEFRPTLQRQRDDAARKAQLGRQKTFDGILDRLDTNASWRPLDKITRISRTPDASKPGIRRDRPTLWLRKACADLLANSRWKTWSGRGRVIAQLHRRFTQRSGHRAWRMRHRARP